jgi:hypothetical protein
MVKASILRTALIIALIAPATWSCNNNKDEKKDDKTEMKDTVPPPVVTPTPADTTKHINTDTILRKGEQAPPPKN